MLTIELFKSIALTRVEQNSSFNRALWWHNYGGRFALPLYSHKQ